MRFNDTPELATWRSTVRDFVKTNWETEPEGDEMAMMEGGGNQAKVSKWLDKLAENGWLAAAWPKKYGGADLSVLEQFVLNQELHTVGAPTSRQMLNLVGPTIMLHGTEEQKLEHLPPMLRGEVAWCQGFSEPGSGSDLASLQTRAVRDGDDYVVNGQKIWTSGAHRADWMFVLTRTDPDAPKHRGISYLLLDMKSPGVTVRPLINMANGHVFNEVFFEDVRVPVRNRIGEENRGWYVGTTTLDFERSNIARAINAGKNVAKLGKYVRARAAAGEPVSPAYRLEVADRAVETGICELLSFVVISIQAQGRRAEHGSEHVQDVRLRALAAHRLDEDAPQRDARAVPPRGRPRSGRRAARLAGVHGDRPGDHRRWHERDPAKHHRHARPRPPARLTNDGPGGRGPAARTLGRVGQLGGGRRARSCRR